MDHVGGVDEVDAAEEVVKDDRDVLLRKAWRLDLLENVPQVVLNVFEHQEEVIKSLRVAGVGAGYDNVNEASDVNTYLAGRQLSQDTDFTENSLCLMRPGEDVADQFDRHFFASFLVARLTNLAVCTRSEETHQLIILSYLLPD